jgi:hypothetical protein
MPVDIRSQILHLPSPRYAREAAFDTRGRFIRPGLCMRVAPRDETRQLADRHATSLSTVDFGLDRQQGLVRGSRCGMTHGMFYPDHLVMSSMALTVSRPRPRPRLRSEVGYLLYLDAYAHHLLVSYFQLFFY